MSYEGLEGSIAMEARRLYADAKAMSPEERLEQAAGHFSGAQVRADHLSFMTGYADRVVAKSCSAVAEIPDGVVPCVVTSPPFEAIRKYSDHHADIGRFRGAEFIERMRGPMEQVRRVLRSDGSAFINFHYQKAGGFASPTLHRFPALLEEVGFRIVQVLYWVKTNAHPTGDARLLKPAVEPIYHVAKEEEFLVYKDAVRRPSLWAGRDARSWKYNPLGADPGSWLCPALERLNRMSIQEVLGAVLDPESNACPLRKSQDQATLHPARMPDELADWLILYGSRPGDLVLDPFLGSGTTACRAKALGRHYLGFELVPEYAKLAEERLAQIEFGEALEKRGGTSLQKPVAPSMKASEPLPRSRVGVCRACKKNFALKKRWQAFCSSACRYKHHNRK